MAPPRRRAGSIAARRSDRWRLAAAAGATPIARRHAPAFLWLTTPLANVRYRRQPHRCPYRHLEHLIRILIKGQLPTKY